MLVYPSSRQDSLQSPHSVSVKLYACFTSLPLHRQTSFGSEGNARGLALSEITSCFMTLTSVTLALCKATVHNLLLVNEKLHSRCEEHGLPFFGANRKLYSWYWICADCSWSEMIMTRIFLSWLYVMFESASVITMCILGVCLHTGWGSLAKAVRYISMSITTNVTEAI